MIGASEDEGVVRMSNPPNMSPPVYQDRRFATSLVKFANKRIFLLNGSRPIDVLYINLYAC